LNALDEYLANRTPEEKLIEYLRSARDYCSPHPDLTKAQLLFEMERARRTLDYVIAQLASTRGVSFSTPTGQTQT
jgi:hypothetical protein